MSFEITKVYTDNPYADEMVYYTKLMGAETVLKMQQLADDNETVDSLKSAGLYISCVEGTAIFEIFSSVSSTALTAAGIIAPETVKSCLSDMNNVPTDKRDAVTAALIEEYIENYEETNTYYRMLHGLPEVGVEDYVTSWTAPDGVSIDLTKPVHEMTNSEALILESYGVLDSMIEEDKANRQYMRHLGDKSIDYYTARRANRFDPLYIPSIDSDAIYKMYKDRLDANKFYTLRTVYSEAFNYNSDYYDNFIAVFIVIITMVDIISRVQEFITRKEIFDIRSVQYIFESYGVPFFEDIPLTYQISMVKNLHTLLKYKSTSKCMVDICSLFGFDNIKIFKYYLLKDRRIDLESGEYIHAVDEDGNEDLEAEFELKFIKLPLEDDLDDYIRSSSNYVDYDEITTSDTTWDGGLDHNEVMKAILKEEFNFARTKYISIDTIYEIATMSAQQSYFFNFLYDNVDLESMLTIQIPYIEAGTEFNIADVFTLLTVLTYYYNGVTDTIMDTHSKVLYVNGFNFKADLALLAQEIGAKRVDDLYDIYTDPNIDGDNDSSNDPENIVLDRGGTLHAKEQLENFIIPTSSIPSFGEMMNIYVNNMEVRDEIIDGMRNASDKKIYDIYKKLYDALMTVQLTLEYYERDDAPLDPPSDCIIEGEYTHSSMPENGYDGAYAMIDDYWHKMSVNDNGELKWSFASELYYYVDDNGDPTYTEYLKYKDSALYYVIVQVQDFDDDTSRNQYIANLIDSIVYALEEYIDTDEFQSLFSNLPVMSSEAVKEYIATVINFYKSYKIDFLGLNTIYTLDDKNDGYIQLIDDVIMERFFQRNDFVKLYDELYRKVVTIDKHERMKLIERIYFDIRTWVELNHYEYIELNDSIYERLTQLVLFSFVDIYETKYKISIKKEIYEAISLSDYLGFLLDKTYDDSMDINDKLWLNSYIDTTASLILLETEEDRISITYPDPNNTYYVVSTDYTYIYLDDEWTIIDPSVNLKTNVTVESGSLVIEDDIITDACKGVFIVDSSMTDLVENINVECYNGYATITLESDYEVFGVLYING